LLATASQLNRSAVESVEFDHSMIAGGLSKIQTADNVFGIYSTPTMRERCMVQLQFMKTRSSSAVGQKIDLSFNPDTLRISDQAGDSAPATVSAGALYDKIHRKSNMGTSVSTGGETIDTGTGEIKNKPVSVSTGIPEARKRLSAIVSRDI
jgi:hypothetical protein